MHSMLPISVMHVATLSHSETPMCVAYVVSTLLSLTAACYLCIAIPISTL